MNNKLNDYINLLEDSLRSGHVQIEKIYNRLQGISTDKYINIRSGYPMKYRVDDPDYVYYHGNYRLCWNSEAIDKEYDPLIIEKIIKKYEEWLDIYAENKDIEVIKNLIDEERINLEKQYESKFRVKRFESESEEEILDYDGSGTSEESENSFICGNDEVYTEDGRKRKIFRKKLGRRFVYENINEIYEDDLVSNKKFLKKRGRRISIKGENLENIFDQDLLNEPDRQEIYNNGYNYSERKQKIIIDDEDGILI